MASSGGGLQGNERYRAFMEKLSETNVDRHVDLPMIAVMGDTSSGKVRLFCSSDPRAELAAVFHRLD